MGDEIGRGVIAVEVDPTKLKVGIEDAKRSIAGLGTSAATATASASRSIDRYIKSLETQNATVGMSAREADKYKLTLRGATAAQLAAADAAHDAADARVADARRVEAAEERSAKVNKTIAAGIAAIGAATIAAAAKFDSLIKEVGDFQDLAEKTGDSAENIASLAVVAGTTGMEMSAVADMAVKLSKNLIGVDDDSAAAGAAVKALGLNLEDLKKMAAADRLEAVAKALDGFADGAAKGDVAMALLGKSGADALGFLKELATEGSRQVVLTDRQIAQADEYADKQAKLKTELGQYAQVIAVKLLPSITDLVAASADFATGIEGINKSARDLGKTNSIADFADNSLLAVAGLVDGLSAVSRALEEVQFSQTQAFKVPGLLLKGDFEAIRKLQKETEEGFKKIEDRPLFSTGLKKRIAERQISEFNAANRLPGADKPDEKKKLVFNGAPDKEKKGEADKIAGAQLNLDIENIRKAGQEQADAYANAERVMQALRSAGLVEDKEYYESKLGFLRLNSAAQEGSLEAEIARLEKEEGVGKRKLDNQKKIVEAQAKLDKMRAGTVAAIEVLSIDEESANKRIAQSYIDATRAAEEYINTLKRQGSRDIAGVGKGDRFRQDQSARGQISDSRDKKVGDLRADLDANRITKDKYDKELKLAVDTYDQELTIYETHNKDMDDSRADWSNGAKDAYANYLEQSRNVAGQTEHAFASAFQGAEDALVSFVTTGKLGFAGFATSIISDLARIAAKKAILGFLDSAIGATAGSEGFLGTIGTFLKGARADGGPVSGGSSYLVGERGPEIFKPSGAGTIIPNHVLNGMGGGTAGSVSINLVTNISGGTATTQASGGNDVQSRAAADALMAKMKQVVMQETRQGGIISNLVQGRG
jgi:lambda family phage tail tape measure protein